MVVVGKCRVNQRHSTALKEDVARPSFNELHDHLEAQPPSMMNR